MAGVFLIEGMTVRTSEFSLTIDDDGRVSSDGPTLEVAFVPAGLPKTYTMSAKSRGSEIAPVQVWDDGQRTYFRFDPDAPTPSIYRADARGREYIVNARTDGTVSVVGRRSDRWVIRYGDQYICIESGEV